MEKIIGVKYAFTNSTYRVKRWLDELPDLIACDFEVASKFSKKEKDLFKLRLKQTKDTDKRRVLEQHIESNGLSHPSLTVVTHFSVAWANDDTYVILCTNKAVREMVFRFLITTDKTQLWHNSTFDFKHLLYNTGQLPKNYIDTQLLAKSLLNDANSFRDLVGLKELMGYAYGDWALVKDEDRYTLENIKNPEMIRYSAIDAAATFKLYEDIQEELRAWKI